MSWPALHVATKFSIILNHKTTILCALQKQRALRTNQILNFFMKRSRTTNTQNTDTPKNDNQLPTDNTPDCTEYLAQTGERINPKQQKKEINWLKPKNQAKPRIGEDFQISNLPKFQPKPTATTTTKPTATTTTTTTTITTNK